MWSLCQVSLHLTRFGPPLPDLSFLDERQFPSPMPLITGLARRMLPIPPALDIDNRST